MLYSRWREKFIKQLSVTEEAKALIPFPFYRDSIELLQTERDEARWRAFFQVRKIGHALLIAFGGL